MSRGTYTEVRASPTRFYLPENLALACAARVLACRRGHVLGNADPRGAHAHRAAAYGIVTVADPDDRATQLDADRLLQRIHLAATAGRVALQHMNQVTERIDAEPVAGAPATFAPRLAALLPPGERPLVTFRVGYPEHAARPSPRRPVSAVLR